MGTELVGPCVKEDSMDMPSIPPGFESFVPFTVKKAENHQVSSGSAGAVETQIKLETVSDFNDDPKTTKSLRRRIGMKYNQIDGRSDVECEAEQHLYLMDQLPKGVIRGCEACKNCQKVTAKWRPEEARRPDLEDAAVFYPSEEEFEDTLNYISSIRAKAEMYGICRIVPPPSWKPPCPLRERGIWESSKFSTRIQRIDKLQNRYSTKKILQVNHNKRIKKRRCMKNGVDNENGNEEIKVPSEFGLYEGETFGFEPGSEFTLDEFQKYADDFKAQYFRRDNNSSTMLEEQWEPSVESIEGEYWRMVEKPTEQIEVLYGADLETGEFGSGFPKNAQQIRSASDAKYINSGWNLNNISRLPGSVLSFENSDISGVVIPWLYLGMCFSSFCWHVEDHHLYSLNYMHWGAPKMWYGVPGSGAMKLEAAMRKHLPDLFDEQPDLLHKLVTQLSPSILRSEGVPVYRCVQNPGEFVLTLPRAYHAGFNCGFNCAEAVNVAPVDWLPHGHNAIELYREQARKTSISHDKLLLGASREAVKANWEYNLLRKSTSNNLRWKDVCGKDGVLSKALKARVEMERSWREYLCKSSQSQALKMESTFDANSERECSECFFDLHLSAAGCHHCSPDKYACLNHAKQLCSCSWGAKFFLFRYDINELNILVEALEGKLSAVYRWARLDLGLALSSYVSKEKKEAPAGKMAPKETSSKEQKVKADGGVVNPTRHVGSTSSSHNLNPPLVILALENVKPSSNLSSPSKKENPLQPRYKSSPIKLHQVKTSAENLASEKPERNQSSLPDNKAVVVLTDDEADELVKEPSVKKETINKHTGGTLSPENMASLGSYVDIPVMLERVEKCSSSEGIKVEELADCGTDIPDKEAPSCDKDEEKSCNGDNNKTVELDIGSRSIENVQGVSCNPSPSHNVVDRYYRQKGPRIAKVVRRINCNVEPLEFGAVRGGKLWCDSRAIYPKGFRSRVRYIDVVDPCNMCYYVSEILESGREGPLFMVSVEHCPSEVFVHASVGRCWEMVRERVNQEISKQHKLGRANLPPLQPPGSLDGMEMFGFSSPAIVQAIQALDVNRICSEYWKSRPLMQIPQQSHLNVKAELADDDGNCDSPEKIVNGLLNKANPQQLQTLYSLIHNDENLSDGRRLLIRLVNEAIQKHAT